MIDKEDTAGRFSDLVEVVPDATVVADAAGRIIAANALAERLLGYRREELVGRPIEILLPERFHGRHSEHREAYKLDPRPRGMGTGLSLFARRKDGAELPVEISLSPLGQAQDGVVIAAIRDVSERRAMQRALRQSEEQLRLLVESVQDYAIFMLDSDGRVRTWSPGAEQITGYTSHEIVGRDLSVFYSPEDVAAGRPQRELATAVRVGRYAEEGWRVRKDGSRF